MNADCFSLMPQISIDYFRGTLVAEPVEATIRRREESFPQITQIYADGFSQMPRKNKCPADDSDERRWFLTDATDFRR
jgi:hypothetical protein